ncbi:hypothetical protein ACHWQZ_G012712 [Mnemiopsis leidyi]
MFVFLFLFITNIQQTETRACARRTLAQICRAPSECPVQYREKRDSCKTGIQSSPTPEILTSTLSPGVVTFPSVTVPDRNFITERPADSCVKTGCQAPKYCDRTRGECRCPNFCRSLWPDIDLICGSDCTVYFSECHFETQQCYTSGLLSMFKRGLCPPRINPRVKIAVGENNKAMANASASRGATVSLTCHVTSSQHHVIEWIHKDLSGNIRMFSDQQVLISTTVSDTVTSKAILEISEFSEEDVGEYTCLAEMCGFKEAQTITLVEKEHFPVCSILGASHVRSFDGLVYRSRFRGDFILAMDRETYRWYVLGRFKPCFDSGLDYCLHSVTVHDSVSGMSVYRGYRVHGDSLWQVLQPGELVFRESKAAYRLENRTVIVVYEGDVIIEWDNLMGVHVTVFRDSGVKTGGLCGNNDKDTRNDLLPRYTHYSSSDFADYLRSWRISNHKDDPEGRNLPLVETKLLESGETLEYCRGFLTEQLKMRGCGRETDRVELLLTVCVYEVKLGQTYRHRNKCNVWCYLSRQLEIMCNPARGARL